MSNYLLKYKGKYRILPTLEEDTHDFPRHWNGTIDDSDIYIACQYGNKIFCYGRYKGSRTVWLEAYIPSIGRGRNIKKELDQLKIEYQKYTETDSEVLFRFQSKDIDVVAQLLKAKTFGASISPFSSKNLPKSDIKIPSSEIERYKEITALVKEGDFLIIHKITTAFLRSELQRKYRKNDRLFDYKSDMKRLCLKRQTKEYIYVKGLWNEYLDYLKKEVDQFYKKC